MKIVTKFTVFILSLFVGISQLQAQIETLNFPYTPGYELEFEGNYTEYDQYNFPNKSSKQTNKYTFHAGDAKHPEQQRISMLLCKEKDTIKSDYTFLVLDKTGMSWWVKDPKNKALNEKHKTQAIKLPLDQGTKWPVYLNDIPAVAECITMDTLIQTGVGAVHAFGVRYTMTLSEGTEFKIYVIASEYYTQEIGKVMSSNTTYIYFKGSKHTRRINTDVLVLKSFKK